jgi:SAM-dependent methyltransferase
VTDSIVTDDSQLITQNLQEKDLLWRQLKTLPAFRALLRSVEARFYYSLDLRGPILDVGCGDGHFGQMIFNEPIVTGIDLAPAALEKANQAGVYKTAVQATGDQLPFPDAYFASAFSNSVLEHIEAVGPVLRETNRVLKRDGRFAITVPSQYFNDYLDGAALLEGLGLRGLAEWYRRLFGIISRQAHMNPPEVWAERLAAAGFEIERWQYYFSRDALRVLEWGHVQGLPSLIIHFLTGHWVVAPWESSLRRTEQWIRPYYEEPFANEGAFILIVARKKAGSAIPSHLPPAQPFSLEALAQRLQRKGVEQRVRDAESTPALQPAADVLEPGTSDPELAGEAALDTEQTPAATATSPRHTNSISIGLISFSLLLAAVAQFTLGSATSSDPSGGLWWYACSAIPLLALALWRRGPRVSTSWRIPPVWQTIPRQRWIFLPAILLAVIGYRQVSTPGSERPSLAILLWIIAIGAGFYAFSPISDPDDKNASFTLTASPFTLTSSAVLFIVALVVRYLLLSDIPFMLNGIEASIGLDAAGIANGQLRNPFGTAWLTNTTLPIYFMALPVRLFGQTTFAIRSLSPIIGSITVVTTFLIGKRIWGREVGLVAAILLLGSHFHLHYSRLGMISIWDPLLTLLALGSLAMAWQSREDDDRRRIRWLWAGIAIGFNAYGFTSARLLPIMLVILFTLMLLFDRPRLRQNRGHLLAALAVALIVALPIILFYNSNDTLFMERANAQGILDGQTGWLSQETAITGQTPRQILGQQFWKAALAFNGNKDFSPTYQPLVPLLSFGPAILFVMGLFMAILRLRALKYSLLVVWIMTTILVAGALLLEPPQSHRLIIAAPALAILAAVALVEIGRLALASLQENQDAEEEAPTEPKITTPRFLLIVGVLAALLALSDIGFYFGRFPQQNEFGDLNTEVADKMAHYINDLEGEWTVYFYGPPILYVDFSTLPYLLPDYTPGFNMLNVDLGTTELPPPTAPNLLFVYLPPHVGELPLAQSLYPNGVEQTVSGFYADPLFYTYEVRQAE